MKKTKDGLKNNKGITLMALVITIIVIVILVGITISAVIGDHGIITETKQAKEDYLTAENTEKSTLDSAVTAIRSAREEANINYNNSSTNTSNKPNLYLIKNGVDQTSITGGWGHYSYTGSASNWAGFMRWESGYLSFGEVGSMNDCHNPYTKNLVNLNGYNYICIDYAIPTNTLAGNPTTYYESHMRACLDESTATDGSVRTSHSYDLGYLLNEKATVERTTVKYSISEYNNKSLSFSFCGWVSPNIEQIEVRVYNIYLSDI